MDGWNILKTFLFYINKRIIQSISTCTFPAKIELMTIDQDL